MNLLRFIACCCFLVLCSNTSYGQKVLQLEKIGKVATTKMYMGEKIFLQTKDSPDYWFEAELEDVLVEAQAIVFEDRIIPIADIIAIKKRKRSAISSAGKGMQLSAFIPAVYEVIFGAVNPPIEWRSIAIFSGGAFALGSLMRLIPPKKYKMGKKYRLRVLDLTF